MEYIYQARTPEGEKRDGVIDAVSTEAAVASLQRRGLIIVNIQPSEAEGAWYERSLLLFGGVSQKDIVVLSRQLATLFEAKVPVMVALRTLVSEIDSPVLRREMAGLLDEVQGGMPLSQAMERHPKVFSSFFVNMVRSAEESGKLDETFRYLADYLERSYELSSKAKNALIYPSFILVAIFGVMILMLTVIVARLLTIFEETGQTPPFYTQAIILVSTFIRDYGYVLLGILAAGALALLRFLRTERGRTAFGRTQISIPLVGGLYRKIFLARFADNFHTLIAGGIPAVRALQISGDVVGNAVYRAIIQEAAEAVRGGSTISEAFSRYEEIPHLLTQMMRIGEETGKLDQILSSLARFYRREVDSMVENLISLIEPALIIVLGLSVGVVVAAILVPLYNISGTI